MKRLLTGIIMGALVFSSHGVQADTEKARSENFLVVDPTGSVHGGLLYSKEGKKSILLLSGKGDGYGSMTSDSILFVDKNGKGRIHIGLDEKGDGFIAFMDKNQEITRIIQGE